MPGFLYQPVKRAKSSFHRRLKIRLIKGIDINTVWKMVERFHARVHIPDMLMAVVFSGNALPVGEKIFKSRLKTMLSG